MVEEIITRYLADDQYSSAVIKAARRTKEFDSAVESVQRRTKKGKLAGLWKDFDDIGNKVSGIAGTFSNFGVIVDTIIAPFKVASAAILGTVGAAALLGTTFSGFAAQALGARAEVDSLQRALTASTGSAALAASEYEKLFKLSKAPGLGDITDVVEGQLRLGSVGFSADFAKETMLQLGNALALVGKGQAEVDGVTMALTQIESKGVVAAEEINQLAERLPMIRKLMSDAFGTSSTEELQRLHISSTVFIEGIVRQMARLERATPGVQTALDNLAAANKMAFADAGRSIEENFLPGLNNLSTMVENMANNGAFKQITDAWSKMFGGGDDDFLVTAASYVFAVMQALPSIIEMAVGTAKDGMLWIYNMVKNVFQMSANIIGQGKQMKTMIDQLENLVTGNVSSASPLGMILDSIENAAAGFRAMATQPQGTVTDMLIKGLQDLQKKGPLAQIETNTRVAAQSLSKQEQMYQQILGGGGRTGLTPVELRGLKRRGGGIEGAIRHLVAMVYQEGQNAVMTNLLTQARR